MLFKLLHTNQLKRHLRQPLHHDRAAFSRLILGGKCAQAGIEQDRFSLVENTVPFNIRKFRKFKPGFLVKWNAPLIFHTYAPGFHSKAQSLMGEV